MSNDRVTIGYSLGALQRLEEYIARHPKALDKMASNADRTYVRDGLVHAIRQLRFFRDNQAAILAALATVESTRKQASEAAS